MQIVEIRLDLRDIPGRHHGQGEKGLSLKAMHYSESGLSREPNPRHVTSLWGYHITLLAQAGTQFIITAVNYNTETG